MPEWVKNMWHWCRTNKPPLLLTAVALIIFAVTMTLIWALGAPNEGMSTTISQEATQRENSSIFGTRLTLMVGTIGAFSLAAVGIWNFFVNHRRANIAEKHQVQELFVKSIKNLDSNEEIIRIGALHGLERLAKDSPEKWRDKVVTMLRSYILSVTGKPSYKIIHKSEPSVEIHIALDLLLDVLNGD